MCAAFLVKTLKLTSVMPIKIKKSVRTTKERLSHCGPNTPNNPSNNTLTLRFVFPLQSLESDQYFA
jgi:hypothetical protein